MTDKVIDLFNSPMAVSGVRVLDVSARASEKIEVTTFGDSEPKYIAGKIQSVTVELICTPQGFKALAALLTGEKVATVPDDKLTVATNANRVIKLAEEGS